MLVEKSHLLRYVELFPHRRDIYALQKTDGSYFLVREPITLELLRRHLNGEVTCGWYALQHDNTVRWVALDADHDNGLIVLQQIWQKLQQLTINTYLEESRRGGHLWLFIEPVRAKVVRTLMRQLLNLLKVDAIEIYPRQDELPEDGVGSLLRGPLGIHRLTGQRYFFLDPVTLKPVGLSLVDQLEYLRSFHVNTASRVTETAVELNKQMQQLMSTSGTQMQAHPSDGNDNKIQELKTAIGDLHAFISQYINLDVKGRGSCPFHPPDKHPSFVVNSDKGYWICFHEINPKTGRYLGGDAIEFYRRLYGLSFKEAVRELAKKYRVDYWSHKS